MKEAIEAEILEDTKAPVLKDINYPVSIVDLNKLLEEYKDIPTIDPESEEAKGQYDKVLKGHKAFVRARTSIEKVRKELKAPSIEYGKNVDTIAKSFQELINPTETLLLVQRKKYEDHERLKREEAEQIERERRDNIRSNIESLRNTTLLYINSDSVTIAEAISLIPIPENDTYQEFTDEAIEVYKKTISQLEQMHETKVKAENADAIEAIRKAEAEAKEAEAKAEIERERKAFEAEKAEFQRVKDAEAEKVRLQQEEINRQNAERETKELMEQQEEERIAKEKENAKHKEKCIAETLEAMEKYTDNGLMLNEIIAGVIPNLKWEIN